MTDNQVSRARDLPIFEIGRFTFALLVGLIVVGACFRVMYRVLPDRTAKWLRDVIGEPLRRRVLRPTTIARRIGIRSGMRVLLVDSGNGTTAEAIAREVGQTGHVDSLSSDASDARRAMELLADAGIQNVSVITAFPQRVPFDDDCFDAVCLLSAFKRTATPREILAEVWRVLRPAGRLSASDVISDPDYKRRRTVESWGEGAGFESLEHFGNTLAYTINFRKPLQLRTVG